MQPTDTNYKASEVLAKPLVLIPAPLPDLAEVERAGLLALADMVVASLPSEESRRMYRTRLRQYFTEYRQLNRESVLAWLNRMRAAGRGPATLNQALAAIKRLVHEAELRECIEPKQARAILKIKATKVLGQRAGNWLTVQQLRTILAMPDRTTAEGLRDAAILALCAGCGLRRREAASLRWSQYQLRDGRRVLVDVVGKGGRIRTVPVPKWAAASLDQWRILAFGETGETSTYPEASAIDPSARRKPGNGILAGGGHLTILGGITAKVIWHILTRYSQSSGIRFTPHDLRRTLAQLMRQGGAELEQIQFTLGHSSVVTTEKYLGGKIRLANGEAAVDKVNL